MEATDRAAQDVQVDHVDRGAVMLSDFWKQKTTVFVFLRHFG